MKRFNKHDDNDSYDIIIHELEQKWDLEKDDFIKIYLKENDTQITVSMTPHINLKINSECDYMEDASSNIPILKNDIGEIPNEVINTNFNKCVKGYHLINSDCIKETKWEQINATIFESLSINIYSTSSGGHLSGMDIDCSLGQISNKTSKYSNDKNSFDISSYRLTTICSNKKCGTPTEIIQEINKRKNFEFYSILVRDETHNEDITYNWLLIPSNYLILDPSSYVWEPTIGKRGVNSNTQIGWNTNQINGSKMSITFSMSSQLWIHIEMTEDLRKFIIATAIVKKNTKYNYIELFELDKLTN